MDQKTGCIFGRHLFYPLMNVFSYNRVNGAINFYGDDRLRRNQQRH